MPVTVVCGGQYGSEGKGKVSQYLMRTQEGSYCVRVGGPNSGHTFYHNGTKHVCRTFPGGSLEPLAEVIFPPGSYINLELFDKELAELGLDPSAVHVDLNAVIIGDKERQAETDKALKETIGSTLSGTGEGVLARVSRNPKNVLFAKDVPYLKAEDTLSLMRSALDNNKRIIIEGTQGFGLSVLHAEEWPYATARDTSAAGILSETGLSPFDVDCVAMVIRTYPIRSGGHTGPLKDEISWSDLAQRLGTDKDMKEYTSATHRIRRVAEFDPELVKRALRTNEPDLLFLNHLDYADTEQYDKTTLTEKSKQHLAYIEDSIGRRVTHVGTGPDTIIEVAHENTEAK